MALSGNEPTGEHLQQLEIVKVNHDEAYLYVSQGLSYQEQKKYSLARDAYRKGLSKINTALNVRCDRPYCHGPKWDNALRLQQKMRKTMQMVRSQLAEMENLNDCSDTSNGLPNPPYSPPEPFEQPPSYDEACEHELVSAQRHSSCPSIPSQVKSSNGEVRKGSAEVVELFSIPNEVLIFYVSGDGTVTTTSTYTSLHIYQFVTHEASAADPNCPPAWIQVGSWTYPLIPTHSPVLESGYGAFIFPNISAGSDSAVGVILPSNTTNEQRRKFLDILHAFTAFKEEEVKPEAIDVTHKYSESYSDRLSRGIVTGAEYVSAGLVKGAALSSDLISMAAAKIRERIVPEDQPVPVDPKVRQGLVIAREVSHTAMKASGFLVKKLGELTVALGRQLAPHVKEHGSKLIAATFKQNEKEATDSMNGVITVAAGGVQGFSTIYMGLEHAARTLAYSLSSETVQIVGHKYGNEVGEVVGNAVFSVGNLALTTHNVNSLGIKAIAKRTAKDTGKAVLKEYVETEKTHEDKNEKQRK